MHLLSLAEKKGSLIPQIYKVPDSADFLYYSFKSSIFLPSRTQLGTFRLDFVSGWTDEGSTSTPFETNASSRLFTVFSASFISYFAVSIPGPVLSTLSGMSIVLISLRSFLMLSMSLAI
jgi:hypothetical protein